MKRSKKSYFLLVILFLFVVGAGNVFAAANNDDENSVYSWGPWKKMASPAAGTESVDKNDIPLASISKEKNHLNKDTKDSYLKHE